MAIGGQSHAGLSLGQDVHARGGCHANADPPFTLTPRAGGGVALVPAKGRSAGVQSLDQPARGIGRTLARDLVGQVALAQFDRVNAGGFGQFVHRDLKGLHADGLARRPDRTGGQPGDVGLAHRQQAVLAGVEELGGLRHRFGEAFSGQVRHQRLMGEGGQATVGAAPQTDALFGFRPAHDRLEHLLAAHDHTDRASQFLGGNRRGDRLVRDAQLGPEPAADIGRQQMHVLGVDPQAVGQFRHVIGQHLQAAPQGQILAVPFRDRRMRLHRGTGMAGGREGQIDGMRGVAHGLVQIARLDRICGRFRICGVGQELRVAGLVLVFDVQRLCGIGRLLERLGDDQGHRLHRKVDLRNVLLGGLARGALRGTAQHPF